MRKSLVAALPAATTLGAAALIVALAACDFAPAPPQPRAPLPPSTEPRDYLLTIAGFNYTDRYIDSFTVNGAGGGNLFLSSPTSSGGGACCVRWRSGTKLPKKVRIEWVGGYCKLRVTNSDGETKVWTEPFWRMTTATITGPVPEHPRDFEVHFYKDGHVEVAITESSIAPRLKLPPGDGFVRPGTQANDPPCPPGYDRRKEYERIRDLKDDRNTTP